MKFLHLKLYSLCFVALTLVSVAVRAEPPKLPTNAIAEDTWFVATMDLAKANPAMLEATVKAALAEKAGEADALVSRYKIYYEKFAGEGAESVTVVVRGDPDQKKVPQPILYLKFKSGADHAAVVKQIREEEAKNNPAAMEITHDGDFMLLRNKGSEPPEAGSEERTRLFTEALGNSDKPVVGALAFTDDMWKNLKKENGPGIPPGLLTLLTGSKWMRFEMTLGEAVAVEVTIQTVDEEAAKSMADAVTGLGESMKAQAAAMKQDAAQAGPPFIFIPDAMTAFAEAFKPHQSGTQVTVTADAKAVGGILRGLFSVEKLHHQVPTPKGRVERGPE